MAKSKHRRVLTPSEIIEHSKNKNARSYVESIEEFKNLTPKQQKLAIAMIANPGASNNELAKSAGYKVAEGSKTGHLQKQIAGKLSATLREFGIFEHHLARVASDALQATKTVIVKMATRNDLGLVIKEDIEYHEVPDHPTRLKAMEVLCKLGNYFPAAKVQHEGLVFHDFGNISPSVLGARAKELEEKAKNRVDAQYEVS